MSFELMVVSDQLRTFIGYNYADVNTDKGTKDEFGGIVKSKLG